MKDDENFTSLWCLPWGNFKHQISHGEMPCSRTRRARNIPQHCSTVIARWQVMEGQDADQEGSYPDWATSVGSQTYLACLSVVAHLLAGCPVQEGLELCLPVPL